MTKRMKPEIHGENVIGQSYTGQRISGQNFEGQPLAHSNFSYADLRDASFRGADCLGLILSRRYCIEATFVEPVLKPAIFSRQMPEMQTSENV